MIINKRDSTDETKINKFTIQPIPLAIRSNPLDIRSETGNSTPI